MSGRIDETNYADAKQRHLSSQSELDEWCEAESTLVAVTSTPRGSIETYVDEVIPELGMPERALKSFLALRAGYRTNSAVDDAHNKAYEDESLSSTYDNYIEKSPEAQRKLSELTERVVSGENITLVCYEEDGDACHRHKLVALLQERVESRESCRFKLSA
jgi:uncharacterized protein YeaO (DUF488 family)